MFLIFLFFFSSFSLVSCFGVLGLAENPGQSAWIYSRFLYGSFLDIYTTRIDACFVFAAVAGADDLPADGAVDGQHAAAAEPVDHWVAAELEVEAAEDFVDVAAADDEAAGDSAAG